jgi:hypothetical protein
MLLWLKVQKNNERDIFAQVYVELAAVTWPGELDLAPDAIHDEIQKNGIWMLK